MAYVLTGVLVAALLYAIAKAAGGGRYANMTEEDFEKEARRSSSAGAAVMGFQKIIDPGHRVEYVQQQRQSVEADAASSGDGPAPKPPVPPDDSAE
jgi:hypothetical protein